MPAAPSHYFASQTPLLKNETLYKLRPQVISARGRSLEFVSGEGVFSKNALDFGSKLLIETIEPTVGTRFCDLGCGWGPVGAFVAANFPEIGVWACDINPRAVQLAHWNFRHNSLENAVAWCGDGLGAARPDFFATVACNPPVRAGNATIQELFDGAFQCLQPGGSLWVVLRTAQGAKSWQKRLAAQFGDCETVVIESGYRILKAVR